MREVNNGGEGTNKLILVLLSATQARLSPCDRAVCQSSNHMAIIGHGGGGEGRGRGIGGGHNGGRRDTRFVLYRGHFFSRDAGGKGGEEKTTVPYSDLL